MRKGKRSKRGFRKPRPSGSNEKPLTPKPKAKRRKGEKPVDFRAAKSLREMTRAEEKSARPLANRKAYLFTQRVEDDLRKRCAYVDRATKERCPRTATMWKRHKRYCSRHTGT